MSLLSPHSAPLIIGATGGSGTRAIAQLLTQSGQVYLGKNHNKAMDCLDFKSFYDHYIPDFLPYFYLKRPIIDNQLDELPTLKAHLSACLQDYKQQCNADNLAAVWGWKGPRSLFFLPLFHYFFPDFKFLHIIRDGRDMAYSTNQNQLNLYGDLSLSHTETAGSQPQRSIALWQKANMSAAEYANTHMPEQYHRVRYEDLVFNTSKTIGKLAEFLSIETNALLQHQMNIRPSSGCGRWQTRDQHELEAVVQSGCTGLYYFGYH